MYKRWILKSIICTVLIASLLCMSFYSSTALSASTGKLSYELTKKLSTMNTSDKLDVTVFFKEMDDSSLREKILEKYGKDIDVYENERRFYNEIVPNIKVDDKPIKSMMSKAEITTENFSLDNEKSTLNMELRKDINREVTKEMNEYLADRRKVRSDMVKNYLGDFKNIFDRENIVFSSEYIEMMILNLSKSKIISLSNNPYVESIHYSEGNGGNEAWHIPILIDADSTTGTGSVNYNDGSGYDGTGVTIGIIEHEGARYDKNNCSIAEADASDKLNFIPTPGVKDAVSADHTTTIASIICGKKMTIDGNIYEGLARGATVYQTAIYNSNEFYAAVETLINKGVNIINFSAKLLLSPSMCYDEYDKAVDKYVADNKIVFVKSAGNGSNVLSPGNAYNAIVVGNVITKTNSNGVLPSPFYMDISGYIEPSYLSNRPDVVAPGCYLRIPSSETTTKSVGSGTSFSAPVVTALAAQLMQRGAVYLVNPNLVKNIIMCGASNDLIINTGGNDGVLLDKSGAGLVNAVNSFEAKDNKYFEAILHNNTNTDFRTIQDVYIKKDKQ